MATTFDEILFDTDYLANAHGAEQWATAVVRAEQGGAGTAARFKNRKHSIARYDVEFGALSRSRLKSIRAFTILRQGQARAFRFHAPDNYKLNLEPVAIFDDAGELFPLAASGGSITDFYIVKTFTQSGRFEVKRIAKPSPLAAWTATVVRNGVTAVAVFPAANSLIEMQSAGLAGYGGITLNYRTGKLIFAAPPAPGAKILVSGEYHLPVTFTDDWQKFSVDPDDICAFAAAVQEVLPVEIGLTETTNVVGTPGIVITSPAPNAQIIGTFTFAAAPSGGAGSVRFYLSGALLAAKTDAPYQLPVNSRLFPNGSHVLQAAVPGPGGTFIYSSPVSVGFINDLIAPTVQITAPGNFEQVSGIVSVRAAAADETLLSRVEFSDPDKLLGTDFDSPFSFDLDTTKYPDGNLKITAVAVDAQENRSNAAEVTININNTGEIANKALVDTITEKALIDTPTGKKEVNSI